MERVSFVRTPIQPTDAEIEDALEKALSFIPWDQHLPSDARILIKPNVGSPSTPETGVNTDPRVVGALIHILRRAGLNHLAIAESSIVGIDTGDCFAAAGYTDLAAREGIELIDLKKTEVVEREVPEGLIFQKIKVFRLALETDLIINLPKMKTVTALPASLGMKNLKGLIPDSEKRRFHHVDLNKAIVDLNQVIKPQLTIIDGVIGSELYQPRIDGVLLAGSNVVSVDASAAWFMGIEPGEIKYLADASALSLGSIDISQIEIIGDELERAARPYQRAAGHTDGFKKLFPEVDIADGGACSSCVGTLHRVLTGAKDKGCLEKWRGSVFAIGPDVKPEKGKEVLYIGNCLKHFQGENFFPGCPPLSLDLLDFLDSGNSPGPDRK